MTQTGPYIPEGIITVQDSDLCLYYMTQMEPLQRPKRGRLNDPNGANLQLVIPHKQCLLVHPLWNICRKSILLGFYLSWGYYTSHLHVYITVHVFIFHISTHLLFIYFKYFTPKYFLQTELHFNEFSGPHGV